MSGHWLNRERLTVYPRVFLALYFLGIVLTIVVSSHGIDPLRRPLGYDFYEFWVAARLALSGHPAAAYDFAAIIRAEREAFPGIEFPILWLYPPGFLLLVLPLGLLPYFAAYVLFIGGTFAAYAGVVRRICSIPGSWPLLLAFPGVIVNGFQGQNGFLTAALGGAALLALPQRPALAGTLFGLLTIKPHLGLLVPVALLCGRQWRALLFAAFTGSALLLVSVAVLGVDTLLDFFSDMRRFSILGPQDLHLLVKSPTFFSFATLLGAPRGLALAVHAGVALAVAAAVGWVWLRCRHWELRSAALVAGLLLVPPVLYDYDLVWLGLPIAWLAGEGMRHGWLRGEREMLAAAWVLPLCAAAIARLTGVHLAPFVLLGFFLVILRRVLRVTRGSSADREQRYQSNSLYRGESTADSPPSSSRNAVSLPPQTAPVSSPYTRYSGQ